jgi:hypothetical protein
MIQQLVNLDENNNPTKDEKYGQERLEYAKVQNNLHSC